MASADDTSTSPSATRGMATVAMLKLNFDAKRDHISMFEPFVLDTVSRKESDGFDLASVRTDLLARHQLAIPLNTLKTLIQRIARSGYLQVREGRYLRTDKPIILDDVKARREQVELRQLRLAKSLQTYAARRGLRLDAPEDALALILDFVERHHVSIALGEVSQVLPGVQEEDDELGPLERRTLIVAEFIQNAIFLDGEEAEILQEFIEGFVLQNTLLLKDIALAGRRYDNLHVVFDSRLLFAALGVRGEAEEVAAKDLLSLLRETGAVTDVFEPTLAEMRRILRVYEEKIGTASGRLELFPTDMTRYFITKRFSPSDIRSFGALLEKNLKGLGFNLRETPEHRAHLTLDEQALSKRLARAGAADDEPRVIHDVACVAGVMTMRAGRKAHNLESAGAVFVSSSPMTIENVVRWYRDDEGRTDTPPIIHYLALSNHAWLKKPAHAIRLKVHELVALCSAALRPSREGWETFLAYLKRLQESGELSSDEVTAVLVSELTDHVLVEEEVDADTPIEVLSEVVERVTATYRTRDAAAASEATANNLALRASIERRSRSAAQVVCWFGAAVLAAIFFAGAVLTLVSLRGGSKLGGVSFVLAALFTVGGLLSLTAGFHVNHWRTRLEERLTQRLARWLSSGESRAPKSLFR